MHACNVLHTQRQRHRPRSPSPWARKSSAAAAAVPRMQQHCNPRLMNCLPHSRMHCSTPRFSLYALPPTSCARHGTPGRCPDEPRQPLQTHVHSRLCVSGSAVAGWLSLRHVIAAYVAAWVLSEAAAVAAVAATAATVAAVAAAAAAGAGMLQLPL